MSQKSKILINGPIKDFKKFFLLQFTYELIKHSGTGEISELKNILKKEEDKQKEETKERKEKIKEIIEKKEPFLILKQKNSLQKRIIKPLPKIIRTKPLILRIPEPKLPSHLEYLKPVPTTGVEIDLWKLNPLIKDPAVRTIEVNPDEKVIVTGTMGTKSTNIILNKEDIDKIINKFSETAKIPINEGIFRVVVGKLILSAIISEVVGSKFIIKKMIYSPAFRK
jgi:hypothetical protein